MKGKWLSAAGSPSQLTPKQADLQICRLSCSAYENPHQPLVRVPQLKDDVGFLRCGSDGDGGHVGLTDGDYLIVWCGNSKGFRKPGKYFTELADLPACGFHHHFDQVRSFSDTKIELMVRKYKAAIEER
jgi:hypothetical protein